MRLVQEHVLVTLAAAVRAFYHEYEYDPRGYAHLRLELRARVCGAWTGEVVVGSNGVATAKLLYVDRGLSGALRT